MRAIRTRPRQGCQLPAARGAGARALARARRVPRVAAPPRGRAAVRLLRGPADRQRAPRLPPRAGARVQGHLPALQDDAGLLRRPARAAGTATACRSRSRSRSSSASSSKHEIEDYGIAEFNRAVPRVGVRVPRGLDRADRADRLLGRPRRRVPDARHRPTSSRSGGRSTQMWDKDLLYEGYKVVPYCPRCGTALSSATRSRRATRTSRTRRVYVRFPVTGPAGRAARGRRRCSSGRRRRGRWSSNAAVAVDPDLAYVRTQPTASVLAEALVERVLGEDAEVVDRFPGARHGRRALRAAVRLHARQRVRREGPHRPARRLRLRRRRHRHRPHGDRVRRGRLPPRRRARPRTSSTRCGSTAPTTSASARTPAASSRTPTTT